MGDCTRVTPIYILEEKTFSWKILGGISLGDMLFADPHSSRSEFENLQRLRKIISTIILVFTKHGERRGFA